MHSSQDSTEEEDWKLLGDAVFNVRGHEFTAARIWKDGTRYMMRPMVDTILKSEIIRELVHGIRLFRYDTEDEDITAQPVIVC